MECLGCAIGQAVNCLLRFLNLGVKPRTVRVEFIDNKVAHTVSRTRHFYHVSYYRSNVPYLFICYSGVDIGPLETKGPLNTSQQNREYTEDFLEGKNKIVIKK
jgi:hypothetical protein